MCGTYLLAREGQGSVWSLLCFISPLDAPGRAVHEGEPSEYMLTARALVGDSDTGKSFSSFSGAPAMCAEHVRKAVGTGPRKLLVCSGLGKTQRTLQPFLDRKLPLQSTETTPKDSSSLMRLACDRSQSGCVAQCIPWGPETAGVEEAALWWVLCYGEKIWNPRLTVGL